MRKLSFNPGLLFVVLAVSADPAAAQTEKPCSTEIVNRTCTLTLDRSYPVNVPTIPVRPGEQVKVQVVNPLPFEILSLDLQSGQAIAGTDQTAGFVTAALPNLKGLLVQQQLQLKASNLTTREIVAIDGGGSPILKQYQSKIEELNNELDGYVAAIQNFEERATVVYYQLNEVLGTIPPNVLPNGNRLPTSKVSNFPRPWIGNEYDPYWRNWMCLEIAGQVCSTPTPPPLPPGGDDYAGPPPFENLLRDGATLITALVPCPNPPNAQLVACKVAALQEEIDGLPPGHDHNALSIPMRKLSAKLADLSADFAADSASITTISKDLNIYFVNIRQSSVINGTVSLGNVQDPRAGKKNVGLDKFLARQVVFAVNVVNEIGTAATSVPTTTQKKSIVTITVLYADPIFEVSAGTLISTLANRSFANQTIVTQNPSGPPTLGNIVITQSISRPTVVVFAGANWRLGHDFLWLGHRRGAFYFTTVVGLNANNSAAEFGVGPSVSWRSIMFSTLYDWGHDVRLTQGEFVGMIWCNVSGPSGLIPKCSGNPPAPSTEKYWRGVFAFGISVRVPTVFTGAH